MNNQFLQKAYNLKFSEIFPLGFEIKSDSWKDNNNYSYTSLSICGVVEEGVFIYEDPSVDISLEKSYSDLYKCVIDSLDKLQKINLALEEDFELFFQLQLINKFYFENDNNSILNEVDIDYIIDYFVSAFNNNHKEAFYELSKKSFEELLSEAHNIFSV